jgi:hypothetical protein
MPDAPERPSRESLSAPHFEHSHAHGAFRYEGCRYQLRIALRADDRGIPRCSSVEIQMMSGEHDTPPVLIRPRVNDRRRLAELVFLLAAKLKYDLLRQYQYDNAGFLHSEEIVGLGKRGLTGVPATVYAGLGTLWRRAKGRDGQYYNFLHRFLADRDQLWHLVCFCGQTGDRAEGQNLVWWLNVFPGDISFFWEGNAEPIADGDLKKSLPTLFPEAALLGERAWDSFLRDFWGLYPGGRHDCVGANDPPEMGRLPAGNAGQDVAAKGGVTRRSAGTRSSLVEEVLSYLKDLAEECGRLPYYFPQHLRVSSPGKMPFDEIRQIVNVIEDRTTFDKWLAEERERLRRTGADPDALAYSPNRSIPQDGDSDSQFGVQTTIIA